MNAPLAWTRRIASAVTLVRLGSLLLGVGCSPVGLRVNTTPSIPVGLYRISRAPVAKGAYVMFCPPQTRTFALARRRGYVGAGPCPGGYGYLMKKVSAAKADVVSFAADGVRVNGALLAFSAPLRVDQGGRALPRYRAAQRGLKSSEVLLMSDVSRTSFDARYFGPLSVAQIEAVIVPVWTWS